MAIATAVCTRRLGRCREAPHQDRPGPRPRCRVRRHGERARPGRRLGALDRGQRGGPRGAGVPAHAADDRDPARLHLDRAGSGRHRRHPEGGAGGDPDAGVLPAFDGAVGRDRTRAREPVPARGRSPVRDPRAADDDLPRAGAGVAGGRHHAFRHRYVRQHGAPEPHPGGGGMDLLGVIFFSLVFGAALTLIPEERARPLVRVLDAVGEAIVKIIDLAMKLAPYGVFGLIFFTTSRFGWGLLRQLGLYVAIVLAGLLVHGAVSLSLLVRVFGGLRPVVFWSRIRASIVTAFSTSSSNPTLPSNIPVPRARRKSPPP